MSKPPTKKEVSDYTYGLIEELVDKHHSLNTVEIEMLENEISQWLTILNIQRQLI